MKFSDGWYYRLEAPVIELCYELPLNTPNVTLPFVSLDAYELRLAERYSWNGASFVLFEWFGTPKKWLLPSLIHDALYQLMREGQLPLSYRKVADYIFYRLLRERGCWLISALVGYYAVRLGGNWAIRKGGPRLKETQ